MAKARQILIAAAAGLSIGMLPAQFDTLHFGGAVAHAKDGNNGGGNGGGGGGKGGGNGGDHGGGRSADSGKGGGNGNGAGRGDRSKASVERSSGKSRSEGGFFRSLLRGDSGKSAGTSRKSAGNSRKSVGKSTSGKTASRKTEKPHKAASLALPETALVPAVKPKDLGGLNSLNRNVNAYLNSSSPRTELVREYVLGAAEAELAADALLAAQAEYAAARAEFGAFGGDTASLDALTLDQLNGRMAELDALEGSVLPEQLAAFDAERAAVQAAIDLTLAEEAAAASVAPNEAELVAALDQAANPNRDIDPDIDGDIIEWARDVLDDKIEEVKEILAAQAAEEPVAP